MVSLHYEEVACAWIQPDLMWRILYKAVCNTGNMRVTEEAARDWFFFWLCFIKHGCHCRKQNVKEMLSHTVIPHSQNQKHISSLNTRSYKVFTNEHVTLLTRQSDCQMGTSEACTFFYSKNRKRKQSHGQDKHFYHRNLYLRYF